MEAREGTHSVVPPVDDDALKRALQRGTTPVPDGWFAPDCFVCGPRLDGLGICPQHLPGTETWATVWAPDRWLSSDGIAVDQHFVWGALDCPAGIAVVRMGLAQPSFFPALTNHTVVVNEPVPVTERLAVFSWMIDEDEHRINGGSALVDQEGRILATGYAQHARVPLEFVRG